MEEVVNNRSIFVLCHCQNAVRRGVHNCFDVTDINFAPQNHN